MKITVNPSADGKEITIHIASVPEVSLTMRTTQLDEFIAHLGNCRAQLKPDFATNFPKGANFEAIARPEWLTEPEALEGNSVIHLRDPRYGWLHYMFERPMAKRLGTLLCRQAEAAPELDSSHPN